MKIKFFYTAFFGIAVYLILASNAGGYNGNATGSHGANNGPIAGCSCHGAQNNSFPVTVELDSSGVAVNSYKPGGKYTIKLSGVNNSTSTLPKFGFQLSAVLSNSKMAGNQGAAGQTMCMQAGSWGASLPTGSSVLTVSGIDVISHNSPIAASSGTGASGSTYSVSVPWTAPSSGSGAVMLYGVLLGVNGNGSTSGDVQNVAKQIYIPEFGKSKGCK